MLRPLEDPTENVFVTQVETGGTTLVTVGLNGAPANAVSYPPVMSANGHVVAYGSKATNLVAHDEHSGTAAFVTDWTTGVTQLVSSGVDGVVANGDTWVYGISADGRKVAFTSAATNLVAGGTNDKWNAFVRNMATGATTLVSVGVGGAQANGACSWVAMSADGRWVGFQSNATNMVTGVNTQNGVYIRGPLS